MPKACDIHSACSIGGIFRFVVFCSLLTGPVYAQSDHDRPKAEANAPAQDNIVDALKRLRQGNFARTDLDLITKTREVQAIPDLKKQFETSDDQITKDSIASALVKLGDKDSAAWDYLVQGAADAIASDIPSPQRFDSNGRMLSGPSQEYLDWAKAHNLTAEAADNTVMRNLSKVLHLGETGDRRAIPLLRQALASRDYMVQTAAAKGLAQLQDKASIPLIIEACRQAPADAAMAIARPLLDFNDPQAQAAAKEFRPEKAEK